MANPTSTELGEAFHYTTPYFLSTVVQNKNIAEIPIHQGLIITSDIPDKAP